MQLATLDRQIETNLPTSSAFRIGNAAKMFAILADKIYSDKIGAVVREIPCNALDIHRQVGQTRPFLVAAPNDLDPCFSIRDFGTGLSHDEVLGLYTTFFDTTKGGSNDQIGGFGLGSKAPFAYTDAFTVTSYQGGIKRVYAAFRGDDNVPQIALASKELTDEPDGLDVKVPVKTGDRREFCQKAANVLKWFPEGSYRTLGFEVKPVRADVRTATWLLRPERETHQHEVLMGPVAYRLDWHAVGVEELPQGVVPIFQVGELDLPPSREALSYDPVTIKRITDRRREIILESGPQMLDRASGMGPLTRLRYMDELKVAGMAPIFAAFHKEAGHRDEDKVLKEQSGLGYSYKPKWGDFFLAEHEQIKVPAVGKEYEYRRIRGSYRSRTVYDSELKDPSITSFDWFGKTTFVFNDLSTERAPKIKERMSKLATKRSWLIDPSAAIQSLDDIKALFPDRESDDQFVNLSDLEVEIVVRRRSSAKELQLRDGSSFYISSTSIVPTEGVYMPMRNADPTLPYVMPRLACKISPGLTVWGLSKKAQAELLDDNWVRVDEYVRAKAEELLPMHLQSVHATRLWEEFCSDRLFNFARHRRDSKFMPELRAAALATGEPTATSRWLIECASYKLVTLPKVEDTYGVRRLLKKEHRRNKNLELILQISAREIQLSTTGEHDDILERFVK